MEPPDVLLVGGLGSSPAAGAVHNSHRNLQYHSLYAFCIADLTDSVFSSCRRWSFWSFCFWWAWFWSC
jgi:hypothetical protein